MHKHSFAILSVTTLGALALSEVWRRRYAKLLKAVLALDPDFK